MTTTPSTLRGPQDEINSGRGYFSNQTQQTDLQRKYLNALEENVRLRLRIAELESQTVILEIEMRKLRAAFAPVPTNERTSP